VSCYDPAPSTIEATRRARSPASQRARTKAEALIQVRENGTMTNRRTWIRRAIVLGTVGIGAEQLWRHGNDYIFPSQFVTVEPGRIFRGAWQKPWPLRQIVRDHKIKTILALAHRPDDDLSVQEKAMAGELGVRWIHIPIVDHRQTNDRAAEDAISDLLDQAASILADPTNQPVFFHCHHGLNRTSMVQIAYRTKYCGWTFTEAADEIDRTIGLVKVKHGPDYRHMVSFYENRVLPYRKPTAQASPAESPEIAAHLDATPTSPSSARQ
jgi:protein-tyrosine phosphatase